MKKVLAVLLVIFLGIALLVGCGGGNSGNAGGGNSGGNVENGNGSGGESNGNGDSNGNGNGNGDEGSNGSDSIESGSGNGDVEPTTIRLGGLKGATTIGMVKLLEDANAGKTFNTHTYTLAGAADELTPMLIRGDLDIAAIPANLASVLYNNTQGAIQILAINTLGVTYIVETGDGITGFADLKGRTIYGTGKGAVPEYSLRYLLSENGLDPDNDVVLEWKSEPPEVVATLAQGGGVAMLPQPYVTVAQNALPDLRIALDMSAEWDRLDNGSMLITGVLVVRRDFSQTYPAQIAAFLDEYKASTDYVNSHVAEAARLVESYDITKAPIAEVAIPYCNIVYLDGPEMETALRGYLEVLYAQNPKSVGEALPGDDFYFKK